jgi:hypothetical protein
MVERELEAILQERQAERIRLRLLDQERIEPNSLEIGCRQVDRSTSLAAHIVIHPQAGAVHARHDLIYTD